MEVWLKWIVDVLLAETGILWCLLRITLPGHCTTPHCSDVRAEVLHKRVEPCDFTALLSNHTRILANMSAYETPRASEKWNRYGFYSLRSSTVFKHLSESVS